MSPASEPPQAARDSRERRFFLLPGSEPPRLAPEDERHALRVLRLRTGDELIGLDGRGGASRLRVTGTSRHELELEPMPTSLQRDPAPGESGALPYLELASAIPKGSRLEDSWARMVALGVAAWRPLVCAHSGPGARELLDRRRKRLERIAIEACKQSGRTWLPQIEAAATPLEWLEIHNQGCALAYAHPGAQIGLGSWLATRASSRALSVAVGPEGGFDADEEQTLAEAGATQVGLGTHILRIEVAAEAIAAIAGEAGLRRLQENNRLP